MADETEHHHPGDPIHYLAMKPWCMEPPAHLSVEQLYAAHEFFHAVLVAGYRLYQVVPAHQAADIIRKKFGEMVGALPPPKP